VLDVLEKAMTEPTLLRPMSPLQISVRSFGIYFRNFPVLLAFAAFLFGPPVALVALGQCGLVGTEKFLIQKLLLVALKMIRYLFGLTLSPESSMGGLERVCNSVAHGLPEVLLLDPTYVAVILFILGMVGLYAAFFYYYAAATLAVSLHIIGLKASFIQILRRLRVALAIRLFGTGFLWVLAVLIGSLLVIPGIILFVRYIFASPVVVLEHTAYSSALRRSRELGRGYWWRVFVAYLIGRVVIFILYIGLYTILLILFNLLAVPDISGQAIFDVATNILVFIPVGCIYPVLIYYDLRIRKEALNLDTIRETV
jgi:hypothetical protein